MSELRIAPPSAEHGNGSGAAGAGTSAADASRVPAPALPLPAHQSLRARGLLATLGLLAYVALAGLYVASERAELDATVRAMAELSRHEKGLAQAEAAVGRARRELDVASQATQTMPRELQSSAAVVAQTLGALDEFDPGYTRLQRAIERSHQALWATPMQANWHALGDALARAAADLEIRRDRLATQREAAVTSYQHSYDAVTVRIMLLAMIGLLVFGSLAAWFFQRMARDVGRLEAHAHRIVHGSRGAALDVQRHDELGRLMHAVNRMALELDERERRIELEGQRRSHQDKMLAVAALAAGVAHEVNNPLAVIAGTAEEIKGAAAERDDAQALAQAELILAHARRAAQAARALADASAPQSSARDWFDLEALVRRTLQWMAYDRRYRNCSVELQVAPGLPALLGAADVVQQVLMQMLSLACDTLIVRSEGASGALGVRLHAGDCDVEIVLDLPAALDFTRDDVQRPVMLARTALEPLGARLAFGQDGGGGARIKLVLPKPEEPPLDERDARTPGAGR